MALNQTPAPRLRPNLRERIARQSFADGRGNNLPSAFRGGGRGRAKDTGVVQGPTREDLEAAQAQAETERQAAEAAQKNVSEKIAAASRSGSLAERQRVLSGTVSNPTESARKTFRQLGGNQFQDAYEATQERRRDPNYAEPKIITKQGYKSDLERSYLQDKAQEFERLSDAEKNELTNIKGSGVTKVVTDEGTSFYYNSTAQDIKDAQKYASERYNDLSVEEKGKLSAAGSRASLYKFIPEAIIQTEEFIRAAASGGIIRKDSEGKMILPFGANKEQPKKTISERLLRTSPVISNILDTKSDPITTGALNVGTLFIGGQGIVTQAKSLSKAGYTRTQIAEEIAGSLSPLKARDNTFIPSVAKSNFIDNVQEVRAGDMTFSTIKSKTPQGDISTDSFIISKRGGSGTSRIAGISESTVRGVQKRGSEFITVEETTYSTLFGKGKSTTRPTRISSAGKSIEIALPNRGVSNVNVDPYRKVRTYTDSSGKVIRQEVELLNPNIRVISRADETRLSSLQAGPLTRESFVSTGRSRAGPASSGGIRISKDTRLKGERFTFDIATDEADDLTDVGKTIIGTGRKSSSQYYKSLYAAPETPLPIIRPTQPKENPVISTFDKGSLSKITSASILSVSDTPTIVGGSSTRPSAFTGTGQYEKTDEGISLGLDTKVNTISFQDQPPATKPRSSGRGRQRSSEEVAVTTSLSSGQEVSPRTNEGNASLFASLLKNKISQQQSFSSRSASGSGASDRGGKARSDFFRPTSEKKSIARSESFEKLAKAYDVFIKQKGKKVKIAEALPLGLATQTGVRRNLSDISASFTLEEVGTTRKRDSTGFIPSSLFRKSKRSKNTFVQIEGTRLRGFGERRDIQRARKRKRGFF